MVKGKSKGKGKKGGGNKGGKKKKAGASSSGVVGRDGDVGGGSPSVGTLAPGIGVRLLRPDVRGMHADILSHEMMDEEGANNGGGMQKIRFVVELRGARRPGEGGWRGGASDWAAAESLSGSSPPNRSTTRSTMTVDEKDIDTIDFPSEYRMNETRRKVITDLASRDGAPRYALDLLSSIRLSDHVMHEALSDGENIAKELPFRVHVPLVMEYYTSQSWSWLPPTSACIKILLSLKAYVDGTAENYYRIENFVARIDDMLGDPEDESPDYIIGAHLLLATAEYAMIGTIGHDEWDSRSIPGLTSEIDALWCAYQWLAGKKGHVLADRVEGTRRIVDGCFSDVGVSNFNHKHLLWCVCCLYIQRCKDLRIMHPHHEGSRHPNVIDRQVQCAKTAVEVRPAGSPHSYFNASYLLMDTQNMCRPEDRVPRYRLACQYAMKSLQVAKEQNDPFYLFHCHILVAYWKMTSAYDRPFSQREIMQHIKKAEKFEGQCKSYKNSHDLSRGTQTRDNVLMNLTNFQRSNPTWEFDDLLPSHISLAPWEMGS